MGTNNPAGTEGVQELNEPVSALPVSQVIKIYQTAKNIQFKVIGKKKEKERGECKRITCV